MKSASLLFVLALATFSNREISRSQTAPLSGDNSPKAAFVTRPAVFQTPIDFFRKLLSSSKEEREKLLMQKPAAQRGTLQAKIREYEALNPTERELRLKQLQLHYYLLPLMRLAPQERSSQMTTIPMPDRALVEERLVRWDMLPSALQKEILEYETTRAYFLRLEKSSPAERSALFSQMSTQDRQQTEAKFKQWVELTNAERQARIIRFNQFFDLSDEERQKVLGFLPSEERRQMEPVITAFDKLPLEERQRCLDSFRRFAILHPSDQQRFLETAQRWRAMPATEQKAWRDLITALPPLPPGLTVQTNR